MDLNSGDMQGACPDLQKLEQIDADSATGNFLIARYWFMMIDYDRARLYAEKVKLSWPGNSEVRALLGGIYVQLGEKYKARARSTKRPSASLQSAPICASAFFSSAENLSHSEPEIMIEKSFFPAALLDAPACQRRVNTKYFGRSQLMLAPVCWILLQLTLTTAAWSK